MRGGAAEYAVSQTGTLAYLPGTAAAEPFAARSLVWVDRSGREMEIPAPRRDYGVVRLSPDETRLAVDVRDADSNSIWVWDFRRQTLGRMTVDSGANDNPIWTEVGVASCFDRLDPVWKSLRAECRRRRHRWHLTNAPNPQIPKSTTLDGNLFCSLKPCGQGGYIGSLTLDGSSRSRR